MIESIDDVKIGFFKYDMPPGFAEEAISCVAEICKEPNIYLDIIPNAPSASLWSENDNGRKLNELPIFRDFVSFVKPHIIEYLKELGIEKSDAFVVGMWGVHYKPKQFVVRHNHVYSDIAMKHKGSSFIKRQPHKNSNQNDMMSILLYLNKPDNSGNLLIEMPNGIEREFDLKGGDVIMFPSHSLWHRTQPNESNEDKFVVVLELGMKWITDDIIGTALEDL